MPPSTTIRECLTELLRLYDWRKELGHLEKNPTHDKDQMRRDLLRYGREKSAAWAQARLLLAVPEEVNLEGYPNLQAIIDGRVSGHQVEWPMARVELKRLLAARRAE